MLNIAAEWKSSAQPYLSERNKGKRVPEAAGLSFQWLVRELWCQNSTVPLPQAGASPMALGGSTGDKLVSFQTEIWVHMTWASSCPRRGAPCSPTHSPCTGSVCARRDFRRHKKMQSWTALDIHTRQTLQMHAWYQAILQNLSRCQFPSMVWHFNTGPSYNFFKLEEKKKTATQCTRAFPEIVWNQ